MIVQTSAASTLCTHNLQTCRLNVSFSLRVVCSWPLNEVNWDLLPTSSGVRFTELWPIPVRFDWMDDKVAKASDRMNVEIIAFVRVTE